MLPDGLETEKHVQGTFVVKLETAICCCVYRVFFYFVIVLQCTLLYLIYYYFKLLSNYSLR